MGTALSPRPLVIELVGVAGAGKTALLRRLAAQDGEWLCRPGVWRLPKGLLLASALRAFPACLRLWRRARAPAWEEAKHLIRLEALFQFLRDPRVRTSRALVLDEGPVFVLAWLRTIGRAAAGPTGNAEWWRRAVARWGDVLDCIVVLDAPNADLIRRIQSRHKPHAVKGASEADIARFLDDYREAFTDVITELTSGRRADVLHFRSDAPTPDILAGDVLRQLNGRLHAR